MKIPLIGIILVLAATLYADGTNRVVQSDRDVMLRLAGAENSRYPLFLGREAGKIPVYLMERLDSDELRSFCPAHTIYRLISTRDLIHDASLSALLLDTNGVPTHLQSDKEVADFLGEVTARADFRSTSNALQLVRAFAALRSYRIVESAPDFKDVREAEKQPAPLASDYKFFADEQKDGWRVYATLFTSEYSGRYERYVFTIYKDSGSGFHFAEPVCIRLRNYIY